MLTVAQVIEKLQDLDPELTVVVHNGEAFTPVSDVVKDQMTEDDGEFFEAMEDDENIEDVAVLVAKD